MQGLTHPIGKIPVLVILLVVSVSAMFLQGAPLYLLPAIAGCCFCVVSFYYDRSLGFYAGFVGCATMLVFWFMYHSFWFLDLHLTTRVITMWSLHEVVIALVILFLLALMIPGLSVVNSFPRATGVLLSLHACGLATLEQLLFDELSYPPLLVVFTTGVGLVLAHRLRGERKLSAGFHWFLSGIYTSKLALLLHPVPWAIPSGAALVLSISPLHYFLRAAGTAVSFPGTPIRPSAAAAAAAAAAGSGAAPMSPGPVHLAPPARDHLVPTRTQGLAIGAAIGVASFLAKDTVVRRIVTLLIHENPSRAMLWAAFFIIWGVGAAPLALRFFPEWRTIRRTVTLILAMGVLFALIQPPLGGESADLAAGRALAAGYSRSAGAPAWSQWMLFTTGMLFVACVTSLLPLPQSEFVRFFAAIAIGLTAGLHFAGSYLPVTGSTLALGSAIFIFAALLIVFTHYPTPRSHRAMTLVFSLFTALLPATWVALAYTTATTAPGAAGRDLLDASRMALVAVYAAANMAIAGDMKLLLARSLAEAARSSVGGGGSGRDAAREAMKAFGAQLGGNAALSSMVRDPDQQWMPAVGNAATILGFVQAVILNIHYLSGSETCVFFLSPFLLLLNRDPYWFRWLTHRHRYLPLMAVTSLFLTVSAAWSLFGRHTLLQAGLLPQSQAIRAQLTPFSAWSAAKGFVLLALTSVTHWNVNVFMYDFVRQNEWLYIVLVPMNILPILMGDTFSIQMLGAVGIVTGIGSVIVSRSIHTEGSKHI